MRRYLLLLSAWLLFSLSSCATGPEVRSRLDWLQTQIKSMDKDGARLCAPYSYAKARAETEFTDLELRQGQHILAEWHMKRAVVWTKLAREEVEVFRKRNEMWKCRGIPKPRPRPRPAKVIDPCAKDSDNDGIPDCRDLCPDRPEDYQGYEDSDGCPDGERDTDGDGIPDFRDKCPFEPEDKNGFLDDDGCPDAQLDTDGDGIPDFRDKCPTIPGVEPNGCPAIKIVKKKYKLIVIKEKKIELRQKVFFATARAKIRKRSFAMLREVADAIRSNRGIRVCIEGHTDSRGPRAYNIDLSKRRARSVRNFLVRESVDVSQLTALGYGPIHPIDTNRTRRGRANNRRVEFAIIKPGERCPRGPSPD
ncbi:MAG: OmpA family protein [Myxococcales bacterium]|nr:OmpA family protein [Myxococcales bacterium]